MRHCVALKKSWRCRVEWRTPAAPARNHDHDDQNHDIDDQMVDNQGWVLFPNYFMTVRAGECHVIMAAPHPGGVGLFRVELKSGETERLVSGNSSGPS